MAATSASRGWSFARRAAAISAVAAAGLVALAIPASAHISSAVAKCDGKNAMVSVTLTRYNPVNPNDKANKTPNSVSVFELVDGKDVLFKEVAFGAELGKEPFGPFDGKVEHTFKVVVVAWDDQDKEHPQGWSRTFKDLKSGICDKTEPSSSSVVPPVNPPVNPPANNAPAVAPAAVGANASLASTGASIALPLAIGALLLVGGGVLLLVMRRRGKA